MGHISHFVTRIEPSKVAAAVIYAAALITCSNIIASAIKPTQVTVNLQIDNKGKVKAFEVIDGNLVPLKSEHK
jgi:hypothetical protein